MVSVATYLKISYGMAMIEIRPGTFAFAPMEGVTDPLFRSFFAPVAKPDFMVTEYLRVTDNAHRSKTLVKHMPELHNGGKTVDGTPVVLQLLGGKSGPLAETAANAAELGAHAIDLNFGCPAPVVNRHDGGASLLKSPERIGEIVGAVKRAVGSSVKVSAKLRLGWDSAELLPQNASQAVDAGADWLTIHARTRMQMYQPGVDWNPIAAIREFIKVPILANGDLWSVEDLVSCEKLSGCDAFMLGRSALANPEAFVLYRKYRKSAVTLASDGFRLAQVEPQARAQYWLGLLRSWKIAVEANPHQSVWLGGDAERYFVSRFKHWIRYLEIRNPYPWISLVKRANNLAEIERILESPE